MARFTLCAQQELGTTLTTITSILDELKQLLKGGKLSMFKALMTTARTSLVYKRTTFPVKQQSRPFRRLSTSNTLQVPHQDLAIR